MFVHQRAVAGARHACNPSTAHPAMLTQCGKYRRPVACDAISKGSISVSGMAAVALAVALTLAPCSMATVVSTTQPGSNLGFLTDEEVLESRQELGFLRAFDGRVGIFDEKTNQLYDVKTDMKSAGTLLFRSPDGSVKYLAFESVQQIDLSDDQVVAAISQSNWQKGVKPVEAMDEDNTMHKLELTREGFYELVSVVDP